MKAVSVKLKISLVFDSFIAVAYATPSTFTWINNPPFNYINNNQRCSERLPDCSPWVSSNLRRPGIGMDEYPGTYSCPPSSPPLSITIKWRRSLSLRTPEIKSLYSQRTSRVQFPSLHRGCWGFWNWGLFSLHLSFYCHFACSNQPKNTGSEFYYGASSEQALSG
jgi:hypothetical protein